MKKISLILATIIITFSSCDKLEDPVIPSWAFETDLYGDPPVFTVTELTGKNVLVEDFTAHQCGNCPDAAVLAEELMENNPGRVFPVAIHEGTLAATNDEYPTDWTTVEGEVFWDQINGFANPVGRINRFSSQSDYYAPSEWADLVLTEMSTETTVELQIQVEWKPEFGHLNVHVHGHYFSDQVGGEHNLSVLILESHIISDQLYYDGNPNNPIHIYDYEFNHILRGSVTGALGLPVISNPVNGDSFQSDYSYSWNDNWVIENSQVIAIVSDENGYVLNCLGQYINN